MNYALLFLATQAITGAPAQAPAEPEIKNVLLSNDLPKSWMEEPINASWTPVSPERWTEAQPTIREAFARYKPEFLAKQLRRVYVVESMSFYGQGYGGTYLYRDIILTYSSRTAGYNPEFLRRSFHHEFSSVLLTNNPTRIRRSAWVAINEPDFKYLGSGVEALRQGKTGLTLDPTLHPKGFLVEYGMAAFEEDVNTFAEWYMEKPEVIEKIAAEHPRIKAKLDLLKKLYE